MLEDAEAGLTGPHTLDALPTQGQVSKPDATHSRLVAYVAISAAPNIVAQVSFVNQTSGIPLTTLVTPQSSGLFRISGTVEGPSACVAAIYGVYLYWTDDTGSDQGYIVTPSSAAMGNLYLLSAVVRDLNGAPLSNEVFSYNVECSPYSLFFTVEQLQ